MRGSWISLFAMLMIFIGPLISQAMPMDHHAGMSMEMPMDGPSCHSDAKPPAEHNKAPDEHHVLWEKCGYCSLLSVARRCLAVCRLSPLAARHPPMRSPPPHAWAMPGKPSSPAPVAAPRPSSRKHFTPLLHPGRL
ncbi:DUF2946 domain-containing protein [Pseudomonas sp. CBSPAW29]|nr:DUF2946 domain-containing protein [Pseudomonas sp. CBSPAW29]